MQINVTRPVVVSTATGLRHFMPGLLVDIPQAEAEQILRQQAGNSVADSSVVTLLDDTTRKRNRPEKAQGTTIQPDPALLADASIVVATADSCGNFCSDSCCDSSSGE